MVSPDQNEQNVSYQQIFGNFTDSYKVNFTPSYLFEIEVFTEINLDT